MEDLRLRDKTNIWHPFTQMQIAPPSIPLVKAKGSMLYDSEGNEYIDAISSWWVNMHGHGHPYIAQAIYDQYMKLEHTIFAGFTHESAIELSEKLLALTPGPMDKVFFSDDGSTSVEVAVKMSLQYWFNKGFKKNIIIGFEDAYHGDTFGAMSISGRGPFNAAFDSLLFDIEAIPPPIPGREDESISKLAQILNSRNDIAAFIFEPLVMGAGGMIMYSAQALDKLISLCKEHGVICIADEVMTGFGRTGKMFATEHLQNKVDIMSVSKGITGGCMPLGLTLCKNNIYDAFLADDKYKAFFHGHSYTGNALACAASIANLEVFENENTLEKIRLINIKHLGFAQRLEKINVIENVRIQGTIIAFDFVTGEETSYFNSLRDSVYEYFIEKGILLRPLGNVLYILPPYCISDNELNKVYDSIISLLESMDK